MKILFVVTTLLWVKPAVASDVCEAYCDYLCRHYRQDIKPVGLKFRHQRFRTFVVTTLFVKLQAGGDLPFNEGEPEKDVLVSVSGLGARTARVYGPLSPGASQWVSLGRVSNNFAQHCQVKKVAIDGNRLAGQWGCGVYNNDSRNLPAFRQGEFPLCRTVRTNF